MCLEREVGFPLIILMAEALSLAVEWCGAIGWKSEFGEDEVQVPSCFGGRDCSDEFSLVDETAVVVA